MLGGVEHDRLAEHYSAADVTVVPSYYEPFGMVAVEALSCATPVVAPQVGGLAHIVNGPAVGRSVPPRDPAALAAAILEVIGLGRSHFSDRRRDRAASEFAWRTVLPRYIDVYDEAVGRREASHGRHHR